MLTLALTYAHFNQVPQVQAALRGMGAVAAGLIAATGLKLLPALASHPLGWRTAALFSVVTFIAVVVLRLPLALVIFGIGGLCCVLTWRRLAPAQAATVPDAADSPLHTGALLGSAADPAANPVQTATGLPGTHAPNNAAASATALAAAVPVVQAILSGPDSRKPVPTQAASTNTPPELTELIWSSPGIWPNCRSRGAVIDEVTTSGLAPGYSVVIWMVG